MTLGETSTAVPMRGFLRRRALRCFDEEGAKASDLDSISPSKCGSDLLKNDFYYAFNVALP
jgi:hypothetical protein